MSAPVDTLLRSYPRTRPPLTAEHERRYLLDYQQNRDGLNPVTSAAQRLEAWMHRQVAARQRAGEAVLELGAGTLNHVPFEHSAAQYDFVEPFEDLWKARPARTRLGEAFTDVHQVPSSNRYDRIFSVAVLEHLTELPSVVAACGIRLKEDGWFQAGIPSEGAMAWGLAWRCVTGVSYRLRTGLDYGTLMRHEHVNSAEEIIAVVRHLFRETAVTSFPTPFHHLSFYKFIEARGPVLSRCQELL
jgi:SAM-dependent methyltransferase